MYQTSNRNQTNNQRRDQMKMQCDQRPVETVSPALFKRSGALAITVLVAIGGLLLGSGTIRASSFSWNAPQQISGDSDVLNNGKMVYAYSIDPNAGSLTINGVTFVNSTGAGAGFSGGATQPTGSYSGGSNAPFDGLSANYQALVSSGFGDTPFTLTLTGLKVGDSYEFEWWSNDSRFFAASQGRETIATAGTAITLAENTGSPSVSGGLGQFDVGFFTADSSTETISFTAAAGQEADFGVVNAYQLRDTTIPEPSILLLVGVGGLLVAGLRRGFHRRSSSYGGQAGGQGWRRP